MEDDLDNDESAAYLADQFAATPTSDASSFNDLDIDTLLNDGMEVTPSPLPSRLSGKVSPYLTEAKNESLDIEEDDDSFAEQLKRILDSDESEQTMDFRRKTSKTLSPSGRPSSAALRKLTPPLSLSRPVSVEGLASLRFAERRSPTLRKKRNDSLQDDASFREMDMWDEKEELEDQLAASRETIVSLEAENIVIKTKFSKMPSIIQQLKNQLSDSRGQFDQNRQKYEIEMRQIQRKARAESEKQQEEFQNSLRETERQRNVLKVELAAANRTVDSIKQEEEKFRLTSTKSTTYELSNARKEIAALKEELGSVKSVLEETEASWQKELQQRQTVTQELTKVQKVAVKLKDQLGNRKGMVEIDGAIVNVGVLQAKLAGAEQRLEEVQKKKAAEIAAFEEKASEERTTLKVQLGEAVQDRDSSRIHFQEIIDENKEMLEKTKEDLKRAQSTSPRLDMPRGGKKGSMQYFGRWTAHRADSRKHAEEMKLIISALDKEGFGPGQASADEVIRYLWWKKEKSVEEASEVKQALSNIGGEESQQSLKAFKEERDSIMKELETLREKVKTKERDAAVLEETFKQEIKELLLDNQQVREEVYAAQGQAAANQEECEQLKRQLANFIKEISQKQSALEEVKVQKEKAMASIDRTSSLLGQEKRKNTVLRAETVSLKHQLESSSRQLKDAIETRAGSREELTELTKAAADKQKRVSELEMTVKSLKDEIEESGQKLKTLSAERNELRKKLDDAQARLSSGEAQQKRETDLMAKLKEENEQLEQELDERAKIIERNSIIRSELEAENQQLQQMAEEIKGQAQILQADLEAARKTIDESDETIGLTRSDKDFLASDLNSTKQELANRKKQFEKLKREVESVRNELREKDVAISSIRREKEEFFEAVDSTKAELVSSQKQAESVKMEERFLRNQLASKEKECQDLSKQKITLSGEIFSIQEELHQVKQQREQLRRELDSAKSLIGQQTERIQQTGLQQETVGTELKKVQKGLTRQHTLVSDLKAECSRQKAQIEALSSDALKESHRSERAIEQIKEEQTRASKESEEKGRRLLTLEAQKGKLEGEIKTKDASMERLQREVDHLQDSLHKERRDHSRENAQAAASLKEVQVQLQAEKQARQELLEDHESKVEKIQNLSGEVTSVREQMVKEKQSEERELRRVMERLQSESLKQQTKHGEQLMQANQAERDAGERERKVRIEFEASEAQRINLLSQVEKLKAQIRAEKGNVRSSNHRVEELCEELKRTHEEQTQLAKENAKLCESYESENSQLREQVTQITGEVSAAHEVAQHLTKENDTLQAQVQQLTEQLSNELARVEKIRGSCRDEIQKMREKLERSSLVLTSSRREATDLQMEYEKKLSDAEANASSLEIELGKLALAVRQAETENAATKLRLEATAADLDLSLKANVALKKTIEASNDEKRKAEAVHVDEIKVLQKNSSVLSAQVAEAQATISSSEKDHEMALETLRLERDALKEIQSQVERFQHENALLTRKADALSEEKSRLIAELQQVKENICEERKQSAKLREHLQESMIQVQEKHETSLRAQTKFNETFGQLQSEFEKDRHLLVAEKENLEKELEISRNELEIVQKTVHLKEADLAASHEDLAESAKKATQTLSSLDTEVALRGELQLHAADLEAKLKRSQRELSSLSTKLSDAASKKESLQQKLETSQKQCSELSDEFHEHKTLALANHTDLTGQHQEVVAALKDELAGVKRNLEMAESRLALNEERLLANGEARDELNTTVEELRGKVELCRQELRQEITQRKVAEQQSEYYQRLFSERKKGRKQLLDDLTHVQSKLAETEAALTTALASRGRFEEEKRGIETLLNEQQASAGKLHQRLESVQGELGKAYQQLNEQTLHYSSSTKKTSKELSGVREQYLRDCKEMKKQVKKVRQELETMRLDLSDMGAAKARLEEEKLRCLEEKDQLMSHKRTMEVSLSQLKDQNERLNLRNEELTEQIVHFQSEIAVLQKSEEELIEYERVAEANAKADMRKLTDELTEQMERQLGARENLYKLRAENEVTVLFNSQSKVSELELEVKQLKMLRCNERKQSEALRNELARMYSQRGTDDKLRRKLETRLERVNETLMRTKSAAADSLINYTTESPCSGSRKEFTLKNAYESF